MKVLIIEDEFLAQEKLERMLTTLDQSITVIKKIGSVKATVEYLKVNPKPDLAFVDIQLSDDHSFEIFKQHAVDFPVVFTTAYDKYMVDSFEYNSIDYLLKPITTEKLKRALNKITSLKRHFLQEQITNLLDFDRSKKTSRIIVKKGADHVILETDQIAYFYTQQKITFLKDFQGNQFLIDKNLTELEGILHPNSFFRLNRKYICHIKAIEKFQSHKGKLKIYLRSNPNEEIYVSKEMASSFRIWVGEM